MHRWRALGRTRGSGTAGWVPCQPLRLLTINHRISRGVSGEDKKQESTSESTEAVSAKLTLSSRPLLEKGTRKSTLLSPLHTSKSSFLIYASQTDLSPESTVFRGTKYEYTCLEALSRLGFELTRIGGRNDAGIDLIGTWSTPTLSTPLQALVQCKIIAGKGIKPVLVRELEGAFSASSVASDQTTVGLLCTPGLATKAVREALRRCTRPVVLLSIDEEGWINTIVWNDAVKNICGEMSIGLRYVGARKEAFLQIGDQPWVLDPDGRNRDES